MYPSKWDTAMQTWQKPSWAWWKLFLNWTYKCFESCSVSVLWVWIQIYFSINIAPSNVPFIFTFLEPITRLNHGPQLHLELKSLLYTKSIYKCAYAPICFKRSDFSPKNVFTKVSFPIHFSVFTHHSGFQQWLVRARVWSPLGFECQV